MAEQKERTPLYTFARGVFGVLFRTLMPIRYHGTDKLNRQDAPYILISNHQAAIDPFVLALPVRRYEIRFIGKREIVGHKLVQWAVTQLHMIPVSRGATDMGAMRACMSALKEGHVLGIFPEGTRKLPEMMQTVEARVAGVLPDGKLTLTLREKAHVQMEGDAALVLSALRAAGGFLPYHDKSSAEDIKARFSLGKNAFKRAIGHLYRDRLITIDEDGIRLTDR